MDIDYLIASLVEYGVRVGLVPNEERIFTTNLLLEIFGKDQYQEVSEIPENLVLEDILKEMLNFAYSVGILKENTTNARDLFDTKIMGCLVPRPKQLIDNFYKLYNDNPKKATDFYYKFSQDSDYIRDYRIKKDMKWKVESKYGEMDITINLSKPEKDPKDIAAAKNQVQCGYPKCLLCYENEGFSGNLNHPARQNLRIIPIEINKSEWGFQYSPYVYYNEHCIVFNKQHIPMKVDKSTFQKLIDFVKLFPHYFIGSNADIPIVGGSILSHDHFQGGNYEFSMAKAKIEKEVVVPGFEDVQTGMLYWPLSVIRIRCKDENRLIEMAEHIRSKWCAYTDENAQIFSETNGEPHNSITPIARKVGEIFEMDLTLRNNITTSERPCGLYHPNDALHHIKKENIGLIEVMGLAVLPARLKTEMDIMADYILEGKDFRQNDLLEKHAVWFDEFRDNYVFTNENVEQILKQEIGRVFVQVLEDAGVYKCNHFGREAFMTFLRHI